MELLHPISSIPIYFANQTWLEAAGNQMTIPLHPITRFANVKAWVQKDEMIALETIMVIPHHTVIHVGKKVTIDEHTYILNMVSQ